MNETIAATGEGQKVRKPLHKVLYVQVLAAIAAGIALGAIAPAYGEAMKPFGDAFVKLIKMIIAPVIFVTVVHGIASMRDLKTTGRVGLKALIYFELVTTAALIIGLIVANVLQPGSGLNIDLASLDTKAIEGYIVKSKEQSTAGFLLDIIPATFVGAFTDGNILQVLLIAVLFAFALQGLGSSGKPMLDFIEQASAVLFKITGYIMYLAPVGAFGAMAFTIGKYGLAALKNLVWLIGSFYLTCIFFIVIVLGAIARFNGFSVFRFIAYIKEELLIVLGTSSSETALPKLIEKLKRLGCEESIVGLVVPSGYSFNLDGTCIYLTMAALFLAQATNTDLSTAQQLGLLGVLLLTSKGAAGVTGAGFVTLAATLSAGSAIPVAALALIVGIDRFMSEARALTNLIGNGVATIVIAKSEGALDAGRLNRELGSRAAS